MEVHSLWPSADQKAQLHVCQCERNSPENAIGDQCTGLSFERAPLWRDIACYGKPIHFIVTAALGYHNRNVNREFSDERSYRQYCESNIE